MRILVAGGAGFLGSHLTEQLLNSQHQVIVLDNFFTGSIQNLSSFISNSNLTVINADVCSNLVDSHFHELEEKFDLIFNLACPASPIHYQKDPIYTTKTSVLGALNLLDLAKRDHATIVQASTSEIYGDPERHPQVESYWGNVNSIGIRSCYDEGKRCAESLFMDFNRQYGTTVKIARIFNTYGPKMAINDGRVISSFIYAALKNEPLYIFGDGNQTRSFCYVSDLVEGLIKLAFSDKNFTGPINLGNPTELRIEEIAQKIRIFTDSKSKLIHKPLPSDDPKRRKPDISKAVNELGWKPLVELDIGLVNTINYFKGLV